MYMTDKIPSQTYTVTEIRQILGVGKNKAYDFVKNNPPFKVISVAGTFRIHKASFDKWLNGDVVTE